jgi:hypothetical protein
MANHQEDSYRNNLENMKFILGEGALFAGGIIAGLSGAGIVENSQHQTADTLGSIGGLAIAGIAGVVLSRLRSRDT